LTISKVEVQFAVPIDSCAINTRLNDCFFIAPVLIYLA
jgi:hypothetical protein